MDYRRNFDKVIADKSVIAIQAIRGSQSAHGSIHPDTAMTLTMNGKTYNMRDRINVTAFPDGLLTREGTEWDQHTDSEGKKSYTTFNTKETGKLYLYQQLYSVVVANLPESYTENGLDNDETKAKRNLNSGKKDAFAVQVVNGLPTEESVIAAQTGSATYKGKAFTALTSTLEEGELNYEIDFDAKKGKGAITGIESTGNIELKEAKIGVVSTSGLYNPSAIANPKGIQGNVVSEKLEDPKRNISYYELGIFGTKAKEVSGKVYSLKYNSTEGNWQVGFAGEKQ